jgi:hypothetical protein
MDEHYKTKDLAEAGFLFTKNQRLISINREGKTCWFNFENKNECQELSKQFWFEDALIPSKSFYESIQTLKNRIFSY